MFFPDENLFSESKMMTKCTKCLKLFLILLSLAALAQSSSAQSPKAKAAINETIATEEELAIRKTIAGIEEAWNTHDMKAYGDLLAEDVHWVNVVGMHWRGQKAVMDAHIAFHKTIFKNHTMKTNNVEIRFLGNGIAIAVVTTTNDKFTTPDGSMVPERQNRLTYVLHKEAETWKIAHGHNVPIDPLAAKSDPVNAAH
jgi:uncharacterized protein (TIGR02246 family)